MEQKIYQEAAERFGTPCYIFDLDEFKDRIASVQAVLGDQAEVCYAMKANPFLIKAASEQASYLEVCSPGEFAICERAGVPMEQIVMSGVNKEEKDIRYVVEHYGSRVTYTVESLLHLERLQKAAQEFGERLPILLRVTSGNQFGLSEELVRQIIDQRGRYSALEFKGLQYFTGTQKKRIKVLEEELLYMDRLILDLENAGYEAEVLEFGPGLFIDYFAKDEETDELGLLKEFAGLFSKMHAQKKLKLELGRYLAASCGAYLTSIVDQKVNKDQGFCIVDGGIHQVNYYGQTMAMKIPRYHQLKHGSLQLSEEGQLSKESVELNNENREVAAGGKEMWNICGSLCTINDLIVKNLPLTQAAVGDVLVFENTGAYSVTEGMAIFLSRDLPKVLYYDKKHGLRVARDRVETNFLNCDAQTLPGSSSQH